MATISIILKTTNFLELSKASEKFSQITENQRTPPGLRQAPFLLEAAKSFDFANLSLYYECLR
jgi:hypothetical protein